MHYHPLDVLEAVRDHGAEADEEHVRVGVGEGPEPVVLLLARRVKQTEHVGQVTGIANNMTSGVMTPCAM